MKGPADAAPIQIYGNAGQHDSPTARAVNRIVQNRAGDDARAGEHEHRRRPGMPGRAIDRALTAAFPAEAKQRVRGQGERNEVDAHLIVEDLLVAPRPRDYRRSNPLQHDRDHRGAGARVQPAYTLEEKTVA